MVVAVWASGLGGCATVPGRSSDDPAVKLELASELFSSKDEPVRAEELIREAIARYKRDGNQLGLAEAYRQYGLFYRSLAVGKFERYYREKGFEDSLVKFDQRYEKAAEYFNRAKDLYGDYGHIDVISNLYISLAKTYDLMNRRKEACAAFDAGLEKYLAYKKGNPEAQELLSEEMQRYEEYIGILKQQAGCSEPPAAVPAPIPAEQQPDPKPAPVSTPTGTGPPPPQEPVSPPAPVTSDQRVPEQSPPSGARQ
jgi:tetratricopeptide (TPR) repeat protein